MSSKETIKEYLARGGKITTVPPQQYEEPVHVLKPASGAAQIMHLTDGEHFFAEKQARKTMTDEERNKRGKEKLSPLASKYLNL